MNKKFLQKNVFLFIVSFICIVILCFFCDLILQAPSLIKLNESFNIYINNEQIEETNIEELKLAEKLNIGDTVIFEKRFENIENKSIALYTRHTSLEVFENGVKIYEYNRDNDRKYKIVDNRYHIIKLNDNEKLNLQIKQTVVTPNTVDDFKPIYLDNSDSIIKSLFNNNFINLVSSIILLTTGLIILTIEFFKQSKNSKKGVLASLGMFAILASSWSLCEGGILPIFLKETIRYKMIENISFFNLSIAFLSYIYNVIEKDVKEKKYIKLLILISGIFNLIVFTLEAFDLLSARTLLKGVHIIIIVSLLLTIKICLKYKTTQTKYLSIGLIYLASIALLNLSFFYTNDILKTKTSLNLIIIGIFVFLVSVIYGYFKHLNELSTKAKETEILEKIAYEDSLTGLFNRAKYELDLDKFNQDDTFGIIFYDLNKLKLINDTYGHDKGDELIISFANILIKEATLPNLNVYRLGGDEFVVIFKNKSEKIIENFAKKIDLQIKENNNSNELKISVSYGIAYSKDEKNNNIRKAIKIADERMYADKTLKHLTK